MNKIIRAIEDTRSRLSYRQPVYVPDYEYAPWKKLGVTLSLLLIIVIPVVAQVFFHNPNAIPGLFTLLLFLSLIGLIWGVAAPSHFSDKMLLDRQLRRRHVALTFGAASLLCVALIGLTAPAQADTVADKPLPESQTSSRTVTGTAREAAVKAPISTRTMTETQAIPYETVTQYDGSLAKGQTRIDRQGVEGIEANVYTVTLTQGKESSRTLSSRSVTTPPVSKVMTVGTYVAPTSHQGAGYTNSDGDYISSPSSDPAGASAQCSDGSYSYSAHRQGTCSHHGGVSRWL